MRRVLTAVVLVALFWSLIKFAPDWIFFMVAGIGITVGAWECFRLCEGRGVRPIKWVGLAACVGVVWSFTRPDPWMGIVISLSGATLATVVVAMAFRPNPEVMFRSIVATLFPVLFVGVGLGYGIGLRVFPGEDGEDLLVLLMFCLMALDVFAYYVGSTLGRRRLAPALSPKKTWEGAIAGMVGSVGVAILGHYWFFQRLPLAHAIVLGVLIGVAGIVGDLAESMVKRAAGAKDASSLLPGHGGVLDRLDSLLFASPVLYYYYLLVLR